MAKLAELVQHVAHRLRQRVGFRRVDLPQRVGCGHVVAALLDLAVNLSATRLPALDDDRIALQNAGTPVSAVLRPTGSTDALWRTELHGRWKTSTWTAGGRAQLQGTFSVAETWIAYALQKTLAVALDPPVQNFGKGPPIPPCPPKERGCAWGLSPHGHDARLHYLWRTMTSLMLPATLAFLVVLFGMPSLIMVAKRKHLVDEPSESRKLHHRSVPTVGGVMLFAATLCSTLVSFAFSDAFGWTSVRWLGVLGASVPIFFMGLKDDIMGMGAGKKLMVHLAVGSFLVWGLGLKIDHFDGLFGLYQLPSLVSAVFSLFVYVVIVNAINLIDGVDGLAGGYGLVAMSAFGMWAYWTGDMMTAYVGAALAGGLAGFLVFNLHPAKIFMGDSGSLLVGLMAYVMAVNVVQTPMSPPFLASCGPWRPCVCSRFLLWTPCVCSPCACSTANLPSPQIAGTSTTCSCNSVGDTG